MKKLTLDLESLRVETFTTRTEMAEEEGGRARDFISRRSCIEQCTTSCVP